MGKKAEAEKLLNYVRKRYYPAGSSSLYPENGSALTEEELLDEWGREFLGEGLRRQTLCEVREFLIRELGGIKNRIRIIIRCGYLFHVLH